jgi:hypothetical protein
LWAIHESVPDPTGRCIVVDKNGDGRFLPTNHSDDTDHTTPAAQ